MAEMIQIRHVRPELHGELMRRARLRGMSLTAYVEDLLEREISRPDPSEVFARIRTRGPIPLRRSGADLVREVRDEEEQWWDRWWSTRRPSSTS